MNDDLLRKNVIDELRKAQGEPLTGEELFERCGGTKATNLSVDSFRHELLVTYLSNVVEIIDTRGQIVRPASPFSDKTPSPIASQSPPRDQLLSPTPVVPEDVEAEIVQDNIRRQYVVEQLKKNGVFIDESSRTSVEERLLLPSQNSEFIENDVEKELTSTKVPSEEELSSPRSDQQRMSSREVLETPESEHASFMSADQILETSGEIGYTTGDDAMMASTPDSEVSLDLTADHSALGSTPRHTHEITLCTADDSVIQNGADEDICMKKDVEDEFDHSAEKYEVSYVNSLQNGEVEEVEPGVPLGSRESDIVLEEMELDEPEEVVLEELPTKDVPEIAEPSAERKERDVPSILVTGPLEEISTKKEGSYMTDEHDLKQSIDDEEYHGNPSGSDVERDYLVESHREVKGKIPSVLDPNIEESAEETNSEVFIPETTHVKERKLLFETKDEDAKELSSTEVLLNVEVAVKEQVEKFEHLLKEDMAESPVNHFSETDHLESVDVMEIVHELEQSTVERQETSVSQENEAVLAATHVLETVHKLEHEFDRSLPICEEYVNIAEHAKEMEAAGDMLSSDSASSESTQVGPAGDFGFHDMEVLQQAPTVGDTVTVTIDNTAIDRSRTFAQIDAKIPDTTNTAVTRTIVVDVIPRTEEKPKLSDDLSVKEEDDAKIEELPTTEQLPSLPDAAAEGDNEAKKLQLSKKRGHALARRRRLMDCCTVL
ncbi:hypothetical protein NECAME_15867 [Necator americanus]|uniref:Uncharacterized protein n=1 Tax=Necator americanus TaxID=51031 RepID=W2SHZ0_NECAM|nr:hypothetical protein NECAME_15867 [Necator americanus]ETN68352.1 hypothetical protein NECAME_15867 [Necator americanus]